MTTRKWCCQHPAGQQHWKLRTVVQTQARPNPREKERESVFLKSVATGRLSPLQQKGTHPKVHGQTNLMSYKINNE